MAVVGFLSAVPLGGELAVVGFGSLTLGAWLVTRLGTRELRLEA